MARHDITSINSPVAIYVSDEEVYFHPCSVGGHLYQQDDPGDPIECVRCGSCLVQVKDREQLRVEIWGRLRERLQSGEYGYA